MRRLIYLLMRVFSALDHYARERLTGAGWLVLATAGAAAIAGIDTNQTVTYRAFTFLAALLAIAFGARLLWRARVRFERELPRYATAGEPFSYRVTVHNQGAKPLAGATLKEHFGDPRPAYALWQRTREPGEERRNWYDRNMGYFRWRWLIERRLPEDAPEVALPALAPGASETVKLAMTPRRRGRIELAGLTLARTEPLGLARSLARATLPGRVIALPKRYRLPRLALPGKRRYQPGGVSLASAIGDSEEFVALRDYRPGDPLQRIHWKSFARAGKPMVREFQDEFFERHALVLDTGRAQGEDDAFEDAVAIAASFVYTIDTQECLLDLLFVGGDARPDRAPRVRDYTAGRGQLQSTQMLEVLAGVAPSAPGDFELLARAVLAQRAQLTSCILLFVDWSASRRRLVEALVGAGLEVRALLVCGEDEKPAAAPPWLLVLHPGTIEAGLALLDAVRQG